MKILRKSSGAEKLPSALSKWAVLVAITVLVLVSWNCQSVTGGKPSGGSEIVINLDLSNTAGHEIANTFYGIFYEDINYAADGGLYPELIRNRSFEGRTADSTPVKRTTQGWLLNYRSLGGAGTVTAGTGTPLFDTNPAYAAVNVTASPYAIANQGYAARPDIPLTSGGTYTFFLYARNRTYTGKIICSLENSGGGTVSNTIEINLSSNTWAKYGPYTVTAAAGGMGVLALRCEGTGQFDLDYVSLMPTNTHGYGLSTWKYGGLRKDLVEALRDLKPGFIRFPGGCIVEGAYRHETAYKWKDTIGDPEKRRENSNLWGYMMSYGLGFHEYFQLCEDLGAEPVPVLYAGILCQARRNQPTEADLVPGSAAFNQLVQDYLDLIEYANGDAGSTWGAKRAANGHPAPFNLKKIGIGNENWDTVYWRNFKAIREGVLARYPDITIITSTGPLDSGWINDMAWREIHKNYTDALVDEHYYMTPSWFLENTNRYDYYRRDGSQIFVGEYAAHETNRANSWYTALCEAAYITGLERNADIVKMSSYAPLFAREGMYQWAPDMIWFDSAGITTLTPNYKIQQLFSNNTGTKVLPAENSPRTRDVFHASSIDREAGVVYTKLVNPYNHGLTVKLGYKNSGLTADTAAQAFIISGEQNAKRVSITESALPVTGAALSVNLEPWSAAVIRTSLN